MRDLQTARGTPLTADQPTDSAAEAVDPGRGPARHLLLLYCVAIAGHAADLFTKWLAIRNLDPKSPPSFLGGFLKFRLIFNPGAAFGLGSNATIVFSVISLVALCAVVGWVAPRVRGRAMSVAVGLLLAGILGNVTDRILRDPAPFHGHVVDFISLPHFAIFNVADICITSAAVLLVWLSFRPEDAPVSDRAESVPGQGEPVSPQSTPESTP